MPRGRKRNTVALNSLHPDLLITECPSGWSTVATWWATEEREHLALLADPIKTLREDDARLQELIKMRGIQTVWLGSCLAYWMRGIELERAYPVQLLARYYPGSP